MQSNPFFSRKITKQQTFIYDASIEYEVCFLLDKTDISFLFSAY